MPRKIFLTLSFLLLSNCASNRYQRYSAKDYTTLHEQYGKHATLQSSYKHKRKLRSEKRVILDASLSPLLPSQRINISDKVSLEKEMHFEEPSDAYLTHMNYGGSDFFSPEIGIKFPF